MVRAQRGDKAAYHRLLSAITPYIRLVAAKYARDPEEIEDTVQDVLLSLHAIRHTYEPGLPFTPWLATIAIRRAIDRLRGRKRSYDNEVPLGPHHETFVAAAPKNEAAGLEAEELRQAVARLPPRQREAITMLKLKEMSLAEAAAATGLSITALKVAVHRAIKSLKTSLLTKHG
jgi:RNA polymerase sigma-70 factor, ECF subfamily